MREETAVTVATCIPRIEGRSVMPPTPGGRMIKESLGGLQRGANLGAAFKEAITFGELVTKAEPISLDLHGMEMKISDTYDAKSS
jgi:hypothetical protein